jgi:hypothetical protein
MQDKIINSQSEPESEYGGEYCGVHGGEYGRELVIFLASFNQSVRGMLIYNIGVYAFIYLARSSIFPEKMA